VSALQAWLDQPGVTIVSIGALVGIAASLLGTFLVLRRESMLSDAISHSVLLGIVAAYLLTGALDTPLHVLGAALAGLATVWLTDLLARSRRVKNDAAIGLVFPALFALSVLLINLYARDVHLDTDAVLLGEIAFAWLDVVRLGQLEVARSLLTMLVIALVNLAFVALCYKELKLATFDPQLATAFGLRPLVIGYVLLGLVSVSAVGAFEAVGAILFVAFVVVPPTAAYLLTDRLWRMLVIGCAIAIGSSFGGYAFARAFDVSIGGSMASATGAFLLLALLLGKHGVVASRLRRRAPSAPPSPDFGAVAPGPGGVRLERIGLAETRAGHAQPAAGSTARR
jgi:manganese/zinc/iron transport system permease protein